MRLIDATKIEQFILNNCSDTEEINTIYGELINAPTIEERKEGRWEIQDIRNLYGKGYRLTCSECGETFVVSKHAFPYERYCRYCGARMKGE